MIEFAPKDRHQPVQIFLHQGIAVQGEHGEHLEGGRVHTVSLAFARELVNSGRAHVAKPSELGATIEQRDPEPVTQPAPEVVNPDPQPRHRRRR